ncbi:MULTISPECIES: GNAT family N-acetyltransferase [Roseobacteraceae]|jgi:putative acetyltransferase|uniref:Putative N-acetyltransferase YafP n=1 Tax=Pseudosulfitobacter pseudonitzschiae TaxID=1402135 RepID=A0A221JX47_9RHOB|nr:MULTISPECIES: GNAT family N-acetyltransferase [Roseobacteraceae]ASM71210.1 putative N-acetyltransferase YafP [Pseudosulfitobacter pseudonitzschiae]
MPIEIRPLTPEDAETAAEIFFDAVHYGTADVYSLEQRTAWAGRVVNPNGWLRKFENTSGFAADIDDSMVGFMTLDAAGYIDLAFVKAELSGRGIGKLLYRQIEARAKAENLPRLTSEASTKAKPFFMRMGWQVDKEQAVTKNGISLTNFKMSKQLDAICRSASSRTTAKQRG